MKEREIKKEKEKNWTMAINPLTVGWTARNTHEISDE